MLLVKTIQMEYNVMKGGGYLTATWFFIISILGILIFALTIDLRNKKRNNNSHISTNPNAKPGDSSNYTMGDNRYSSGGQ